MPGKKKNNGRDGVAGVQAISRKSLEVVIMDLGASAAPMRQGFSNLVPTQLGNFFDNSGSAATSVPGFQTLINQQRIAKKNIDMTIDDRRMPAIALKHCFRWIETPKPFKRCKLSLRFIPGGDGNRQDRQVVHRYPQGKMGKTPVERAQLMGGVDIHHRTCAFRKHADHLVGLQKPCRLLKE